MATYLITSGGTKVHIDEVRHVGNMSSGRFGADIAREALRAGHEVIFLYAKGSVRPDQIVLNLRANTATNRDRGLMSQVAQVLGDHEYLDAVQNRLYMDEYRDFDEYAAKLEKWLTFPRPPDVTVLAAAVSDYGMAATGGKISSDKDEITFTMARLPKLITKVKEWQPATYLVGFKLLVDATLGDRIAAVEKQIAAARSDLVVVNDLRDIKKGNHILWCHPRAGAVIDLRGGDLASDLVGLLDRRPT